MVWYRNIFYIRGGEQSWKYVCVCVCVSCCTVLPCFKRTQMVTCVAYRVHTPCNHGHLLYKITLNLSIFSIYRQVLTRTQSSLADQLMPGERTALFTQGCGKLIMGATQSTSPKLQRHTPTHTHERTRTNTHAQPCTTTGLVTCVWLQKGVVD